MNNIKENTVEVTEKAVDQTTPDSKADSSEKKAATPVKKKRKWVRRIFGTLGVILLLVIIAAVVLLYGPVTTMMSIEQMDDGIYKINYNQNYQLDKALSANITTEDEFLKFASDTFFFGYPLEANPDYVVCSTFLTKNEEGQYLAGRNFDYSETDLLTVYTHPSNGYASIGMVPLGSLYLGTPGGIETMSNIGKILMLASPYLCVDGINEKGLMVAVLDLDPPKIRQDSGKPKINTMIAVRMILDRAATTDEAVEMLRQYDFNSMSRYAQHLYIADANGKSVVVEWQMNNTFGANNGFEMHVIESQVCTNFWLWNTEPTGKCNRYDTMTKRLSEKPVNSSVDAMETLNAASVSWTEWSCVYQLSDFSVDIVLDNKHSKVFHISQEDFK